MNILIIDDEQRICKALKTFLEKKSHNVDVINNPLDLLDSDFLDISRHDIICVDINMPCMKGDAVVKLLESKGIEGEIFIITGVDDKLMDFLDLKYYTIIKKPFSLNEIEKFFDAIAIKKGYKNEITRLDEFK